MSIMQEFEQYKKQVGIHEWNMILEYVESNPMLLLSDVLYNKKAFKVYEEWKKSR